MNEYLRKAVAICVTALFLLAGCGSPEERADQPTPAFQTETERTFRKIPVEALDTLGLGDFTFNPTQVFVSNEGDVYVYNGSLQTVTKYDKGRTQSIVFGNGLGAGPGEHTGISDFGIDELQRTWTFDNTLNRITRFDRDGNLISTQKLSDSYRNAFVVSGSTVASSVYGTPMFSKINSDGVVTDTWG